MDARSETKPDAMTYDDLLDLLGRLEAFAATPGASKQHKRDLTSAVKWLSNFMADEMWLLKEAVTRMERVREAKAKKHPALAKIDTIIVQGLERSLKPKEIMKTLADEGYDEIPKPTLRKRIERLRKPKTR